MAGFSSYILHILASYILSFKNMEENSVSLQDAFERFRLKRKVEVSVYLL